MNTTAWVGSEAQNPCDMIPIFAITGGWSSTPMRGVIVAVHTCSSSGSSGDSEAKHPDRNRQRQKIANDALLLRMKRRSGLDLLSLATAKAYLVA